MKKTIALLLVTVYWSLVTAPAAHAGIVIDMYAGLDYGAGAQTMYAAGDHRTEGASAYGAMLGIDIPFLRAEAEYNYLRGDRTDMHVGMLNAYLKMPTVLIMPYIGAGIGTVFGGDAYGESFNGAAAYQGMLGLTFDLPATPLKFDVEGRVLYAPDLYEIPNATPDLLHYDARVKLRFVF